MPDLSLSHMPLNALRAFAIACEAGGIRAAARVLSISASAVHRHVRALEARFDLPLVQPGPGPWRLTREGERLARDAAKAFGVLSASVETLREGRHPNSLAVATTESFAALWLLPRLPRLRARHPRLELSLLTDRRTVDIPAEADLAVRMGAGPWPDPICEPLMDETIFPVLSPSLWHASRRPRSAAALLNLPLLHDRDPQSGWRQWLKTQDIEDRRARNGARFTSTHLVLTAAAASLGVAIARARLAEQAIEKNELVDVFRRHATPLGASYWLIRPQGLRIVEQQFVEWLREEATA